MKNLFLLLVMFTFINLTFAQTSSQQKTDAKELMETNRNWAKAATPEDFFSFINPDALVLAPDKGILKGHEQIGDMLAEFQTIPGFQIKWEPQEAFVSIGGDLGYSIDLLLVSYDGENGKKVEIFEKGVTIWKKNNQGIWKMVVDAWNVDKTITSIYKQ